MKFLIGILLMGVALATQEECGENAHFTDCGTACPLTCDNFQDPPKFCVAMCVAGCYCNEGFVKTNSGSCVKPEDCPKTRVARLARACKDEKKIGPCRGAFPRFYFNQQSGQCEGFTYGGCQGNSNNFNSKEDCEAVCMN